MNPLDPYKNLEYYNKHAEDLTIRYLSAEVDILHKELLECFKGSRRLLELGSGSGRDMLFLLDQGFDVYGIDGSEAMIKECYSKNPQLEGRISHAVLPDGPPEFEKTFDGIYSIAVLMHLEGEALLSTLQKCYKSLISGGKMYVSVPEYKEAEPGEVRRTNGYDSDQWLECFEESEFTVFNQSQTVDGLGRKHRYWYNFILERL